MHNIIIHEVGMRDGLQIEKQSVPFETKMVEIHEETFLKTLRNKLLWGEDKRN